DERPVIHKAAVGARGQGRQPGPGPLRIGPGVTRPEEGMNGKKLATHRQTIQPGRAREGRALSAGFTPIGVMIVVVVIGILAAIAIPNYVNMQNRAREGSVKSNMHTLQMAIEDFSLLNDGQYPTSASATVPDGRTLAQVCPISGYPLNPFTKQTSVLQWNVNPTSGHKGELALNPALATSYIVKGNGANGDTLALTLTTGQ